MDDKKDGPAKGNDRGGADAASKRPYATIDLKAKEVKPEAPASGATTGQGVTPPSATSQTGTAAKVAAAAASVSANAKTGPATAAGSSTGSAKPMDMPKPQANAAANNANKTSRVQPSPANGAGSGIGGLVSHVAAGLAGGALAFVAATQMFPSDNQRIQSQAAAETSARLAALEKSVRETQARPASDAPSPAVTQAVQRLDAVTKDIGELKQQQAKLATDTAALREAAQKASSSTGAAERIAKLEEQLATMVAIAEADPARAARLPQLAQLTGKVADLETALTSRLATLRKDVAADVEGRIQAGTEASEAARSGTQRLDREVAGIKSEELRITQRLDQLKASSDRLDQSLRLVQEDVASAKATLDGFRGDMDSRLKATAKPADVSTAVTPLTQKIATLEDGLKGVMRAEDDRRASAERIVLSLELGNLKRAMERGAPYATELAEVRKVGGDRLGLSALARYQNEGVPTVAELARNFRPLADSIIDAEQEKADTTVMDRLISGAKSVVRVRKTSYGADDDSAEAVVARMEAALKDGRLGDALAEFKKLPAKAQAPAQDWLRKVEARQSVEAAIVSLDKSLKSSLSANTKGEKQ